MTQGFVALDIDGTILSNNRNPSPALCDLLFRLHKEGWIILFATGRTPSWSLHHLKDLPFPFFLAAFNGAIISSYPEGNLLHSSSLALKDIFSIAPYIDRFGIFAYEMGGEERVFTMKKNYSDLLKKTLEKRKGIQKEEWVEFSSIKEFPSTAYASFRFFVAKQDAEFLRKAIEANKDLLPLSMKDAYNADVHVIQVTAKGSSKGAALRYLCKKYPPRVGTIGAGDDGNDFDLVETADIGIAVGDAPQELCKIAYMRASSPEMLHHSLERAHHILMEKIDPFYGKS